MKVVVLPGLDGTGQLLISFAAQLRIDHDVEVVSYPADLVTYRDLADWLGPRLPKKDYAIVAESFSGPLAVEIAASRPEGLTAVAFVASFLRSPRRIPYWLIKVLRLFPFLKNMAVAASTPLVMGSQGTPSLRREYQSALREVPMNTLVERLCAVSRVDVRERLSKIAVPLAYLRATKDRLVPISVSSEVGRHCAPVLEVEAPHFLLQVKPNEAALRISEFISQLD